MSCMLWRSAWVSLPFSRPTTGIGWYLLHSQKTLTLTSNCPSIKRCVSQQSVESILAWGTTTVWYRSQCLLELKYIHPAGTAAVMLWAYFSSISHQCWVNRGQHGWPLLIVHTLSPHAYLAAPNLRVQWQRQVTSSSDVLSNVHWLAL